MKNYNKTVIVFFILLFFVSVTTAETGFVKDNSTLQGIHELTGKPARGIQKTAPPAASPGTGIPARQAAKVSAQAAAGQQADGVLTGPRYVEGELFVKFRDTGGTFQESIPSKTSATLKTARTEVKKNYSRKGVPGLYLIRATDDEDLAQKKSRLDADPAVEYTSYNYIRHIDALPNDPYFWLLWGLNNTGQTVGTIDADIDAPEAWALTNGSSDVVIAVIDTGVDYLHPDLAANMWTNLSDGSHGYDFFGNDKDPMDFNTHGTHCAGTIAGVGNNSIGVTGVNWNAQIMALRFLDQWGSGTDADAIDAINYASQNGADVISNSWGGYGYNPALRDAICNSGILTVCAAGNDNSNNDAFPHYPSSYDCPNIISVAASDSNDNRASFSNYGGTSVDVAAPGVTIVSTVSRTYLVSSPVFSDDFTNLGNWHNTGNQNWALDATPGNFVSAPSSVATGAYANNANYYLDSDNPVSLAGLTRPALQFSMKGQTQPDYDIFYVYVSTDGSTWETLTKGSGNFGGWNTYVISLDKFMGQSIYLRIALETDASVTSTGIWIDDLKIGNADTPVTPDTYGTKSGTSMATPHVAGIAGLIKARYPDATPQQLKDAILLNTDVLPQWQTLTVTGGRANAYRALASLLSHPAVSSFMPLSGYRNSTISYTLTGTNFLPGATVFLNRSGSTPIQATVGTRTSTRITGTVALPPDASSGLWNADVFNTDGAKGTKLNAFTVTIYPAPVVAANTPLSGYRNNSVSLTIYGSNFQPGSVVNLSRADYGNVTGSPGSITATRITATFVVPAGAPTGLWSVNVTTKDGGEKGRLNSFTVNNFPAPAVTTITPSSGYRNNSVSFTVTGTNFQPGSVVNLSRTGYGNVTAITGTITGTQITGTFAIPAGAPTGVWNVNVTTKDGGEKGRINGFTVANYPVPAVTGITPLFGYRNNSVSFTVTGTNFQPGAVVNLSRADYGNITGALNSITATQITGTFDIPYEAPTGVWNVNVTTKDGGERGMINGFTTANYPVPAVTGIAPVSGYRNNSVSFTVTGSNFQPGSVVNLSRADYGNVTATTGTITATQITGIFDIPAGAPTGLWNVNVTTKDGGERGRLNGFTVTNFPAPAVSSTIPPSGYRNNSVSFTVTGSNFQPGSVVNLSRIGYGNITGTTGTITATRITGTFAIPAGAPTGLWNVNVTTKDGGEKGRINGFTVNNFPAPVVAANMPLSGYRNSSVTFTVYGLNFQPGAVVNLSRADYGNVTATTGTIAATQITGSFAIPAGAPTGLWNVNVTTKDGGERGRLNGFTVNNYPAPVVSGITPVTGNQGSIGAFTVTGNYFQPGSVVNLSRADYGNITAATGTIMATRITGTITIPALAPTGLWNVNVTTKDGGEKGKLNGFTVTAVP